MINKKYKYGYIVVIIICIITMAVGAKYDWQITDSLYNPKNVFGILFEGLSWIPMYSFLPIWGASMMIRNKNNMCIFAAGTFLLIATNSVFAYKACFDFAKRGFIHKANPYICGIIGGVVAAVIFLLMRKFKSSTIRKIQGICAFAFIYMIGYLGSIVTLKVIFGRDRYEDIITGGSFSFADWFKPDFFSGGSSFPSGHVGAAMGIMILLLLPFIFKPFKNKEWPLFIFCYIYVFCTSVSRMITGRHFISDTAMSILVMTIIFMILTPFFEKTYKKMLLK